MPFDLRNPYIIEAWMRSKGQLNGCNKPLMPRLIKAWANHSLARASTPRQKISKIHRCIILSVSHKTYSYAQ